MSDAIAAARLVRVREAMARRGVGALLLAAPHHATFATGARRVQLAGSGGSVPWAVVRTTGAPVVFTTDPDGAGACVVEPLAWDRERTFARIAALLADLPGTVACDVHAPALAAALGRELVDAAPVLADAVAPRTRAELDAVAAALAAARDGVRRACAAAAPGRRAADLVAAFAGAMPAAGAGFPTGEPLVWRSGVRLAPDVPFARDDVVALETGVWRAGHAGVAGDTVVVGGAPPDRRAWSAALCAVAKACRAGATAADVAAAATAAGAGAFGLLAHGLGVGVEPPFVELDAPEDAPLRAGTVLVLAPVAGAFRATRALVVTDGAPHWLEPAP